MQPLALWGDFRRHAAPLTCSPWTSAVVMAMSALVGVCISLLGWKKKWFQGSREWGSSFLCPLLSPSVWQSRKRACVVISSWGKQTLGRCNFTVWGCKAHYSSWSFLCSPRYTKMWLFWNGLDDGIMVAQEKGLTQEKLGGLSLWYLCLCILSSSPAWRDTLHLPFLFLLTM